MFYCRFDLDCTGRYKSARSCLNIFPRKTRMDKVIGGSESSPIELYGNANLTPGRSVQF